MLGSSRSTRQTASPPQAPLDRSSTHSGTRPAVANPFTDLAGLSLNDDTPPPPPYQIQNTGSPVPAPATRPPGPASPTLAPRLQQQPYSPPRQSTSDTPNTGRRTSQAPPAADVRRRNSVEDPLSALGRYDIVLLVDDSPSMNELWDETRDALMGLVAMAVQYDKDGVDLYWLNEPTILRGVKSPTEIRELFESVMPSGSTPIGFQLDEILRLYIEKVEDAKVSKERVKPLIVLCLTDGRADDPDMVKEIIVEMAQRLDEIRAPPYQCGISFIQVGNDADAAAFLQELDDDLKQESGVRDMVDTLPYQQRLTVDFLLKAMLGSVVRNLDEQR